MKKPKKVVRPVNFKIDVELYEKMEKAIADIRSKNHIYSKLNKTQFIECGIEELIANKDKIYK